jgi:bacillithiol biosynthesis cysteine-adding enzyme BshC
MLTVKSLPLKKELFNDLVFDYLSQKKELRDFYSVFPDKKGFAEAIGSIKKNKYNRSLLVDELTVQAKFVKNTSAASESNITLLKEENTFTIVTGHQLCLFTGPLYFIYKIFSVINLCEVLKKEFPENNFVPVYWLAGEDHDFEEVNHFHFFGKKIEWTYAQGGALGNYSTKGLDQVQKAFKEILGNSPNAIQLNELFEQAYLHHSNMADATRYLVNALFGEYGLVTLDGNSKSLKESFIPFFEKDSFENIPYAKVTSSIEALKQLKYDSQVNPREINCFYLEGNVRARIEKDGDKFKVVGTEKSFSKAELEQLLKTSPEKLSPNVVLRPCYQQFILPSLAYVGGPGELAYWLEYKAMFDALGIYFPVLVPRNFVTIADSTTLNKVNKLGFKTEDFFEEEQSLINTYLQKNGETKALGNIKAEIERIYGNLFQEATSIDKTLSSTTEAEKQKALNSISMIEQKLNKAMKLRSETELNQIRSVKAKLFPNNIPQERYENFSTFYLKWGEDFMEFLKAHLTYELNEHRVLVIEES